MKRLIVVLALASAGCTTYPPYAHIEYGGVYDSYGYGYGFSSYPGYIVYPGYGYGEGYQIHRQPEPHEDGHWRGDQAHWRDHRAMTGRYGDRRGYMHAPSDRRRHGEPSMNRHNEHSSGREPVRPRTYRPSPSPGRYDGRQGMTRYGRHHHDDRQR